MFISNILLIINALAYFLVFFLYQKREKVLGAGSIIILLYTGSAVASIFLFNHSYSAGQYDAIKFFPFVYLLTTLIIAFQPIVAFKEWKHKTIIQPNKTAFYALVIFIIFLVVAKLPYIFDSFSDNLMQMTADATYFSDVYQESTDGFVSDTASQSNLLSIFYNLLSSFSIFLFFYYLTFEKRNALITVGLLVSLLIAPLDDIANARRGGTIGVILLIITLYFLFRPYYKKKIKKIVSIIMGLSVTFFAIGVILITNSRFSQTFLEEDYASYSVLMYYGQPQINFNNYGLNAGGIRYGDRTITVAKKIVDPAAADTYRKRLNKYSSMKMNESVFYTFVGDFTLDFGPFLAFFIICLGSIFFRKMIKNWNVIYFYQLIPLYIIIYLFIRGWPLFPFANVTGNSLFILYILLYLYFKIFKQGAKIAQ